MSKTTYNSNRKRYVCVAAEVSKTGELEEICPCGHIITSLRVKANWIMERRQEIFTLYYII